MILIFFVLLILVFILHNFPRLSCHLSPCSSFLSFPFVLFFPSVSLLFIFLFFVIHSFGFSLSPLCYILIPLFSSMLSSHSFFSFLLIRSFSYIFFIHSIILTLPRSPNSMSHQTTRQKIHIVFVSPSFINHYFFILIFITLQDSPIYFLNVQPSYPSPNAD